MIYWMIFIAVGLYSVNSGPQADVKRFNMSLYCNDNRFNQLHSPVDVTWPVLLIFFITFLVVILMGVDTLTFGTTRHTIRELINYFFGLLLCWDICYILQVTVGYPIPSFFQNEELKKYYCDPNSTLKISESLQFHDLESRGSFPSFMICITTYVSIYLLLLFCYLDTDCHIALKFSTLLIPGIICYIYGIFLWKYHQNHIADLIAGAVLGCFLSVFTMVPVYFRNNELEELHERFASTILTTQRGRGETDFELADRIKYTYEVSPEDEPITVVVDSFAGNLNRIPEAGNDDHNIPDFDDPPPSYESLQKNNEI